MWMQISQIKKVVNTAKQGILGDMVFEIEGITQPFLRACLMSYHPDAPQSQGCHYHIMSVVFSAEFFNTIGPEAEIQTETLPRRLSSAGGQAIFGQSAGLGQWGVTVRGATPVIEPR
jgi:hypothetical protein